PAAQPAPGAAAVGGGWVGWVGYGLGARIEELPPGPPAPVPQPLCALAYYDHVIVYDGGRWWFEALGGPGRAEVIRDRLAIWERRMGADPGPPRPVGLSPFLLTGSGEAAHLAAVAECRERIAAGEIFQAN